MQIYLSSPTHSVPWVIEELDAVDSWQYPLFYNGWLPKESIGRTDRFLLSALSDISEEMIKLWFFWVFSNHDVFTLVFLNHFLCLLLLPFFFKVQSKIGVRIIYLCALYTVNTVVEGCLLFVGPPLQMDHHQKFCILFEEWSKGFCC